MCTLKLAIDPGYSGTKAVYAVEGGSPELMVMSPEVFQVSAQAISTTKIGYGKPEDYTWLKERKDSPEAIAVGQLARDLKASAQSQLKALKYESALYKIAGIVGAIVEKHQLPHKLELEVGVLLPYGEYSSRHRLGDSLREYLQNFHWQQRSLRIKVAKAKCQYAPEGYGGLVYLGLEKGEDWLQNRQIAVLMFGHRNTSFLWFERGGFRSGNTSDLGFYLLLEKIVERSAGQNLEQLTSLVYDIGDKSHPDHPLIQFLLKSQEVKHRQWEAQQLVAAISTSREEYWQLVKGWLTNVVPRKLHEIILLGGAGQYLLAELNAKYSWANLHWLDGLIEPMLKTLSFPLPQDKQRSLAYRCIDIYVYFAYLYEEFTGLLSLTQKAVCL